jgi:hypothetical protein
MKRSWFRVLFPLVLLNTGCRVRCIPLRKVWRVQRDLLKSASSRNEERAGEQFRTRSPARELYGNQDTPLENVRQAQGECDGSVTGGRRAQTAARYGNGGG